jgi:hypothetical protein
VLDQPISSSTDQDDVEATDQITCCATSCTVFDREKGLTDLCFFGTKSGDVIAFVVRNDDSNPAASPKGKTPRRRSSLNPTSPSLKATMAAALFATRASPTSSGTPSSSPAAFAHDATATTAATNMFRVMICQRSISVLAASGRLYHIERRTVAPMLHVSDITLQGCCSVCKGLGLLGWNDGRIGAESHGRLEGE